jgi:hypothetical protein
VKPCSSYDGSPERLLQTAQSAAGSVPTTKKKASAAKDALLTGLLAEACRAGGLPEAQQRAVDLLTDVFQHLLHPMPERADVERLRTDAAVAVAEFEHAFPPTDMSYVGVWLPRWFRRWPQQLAAPRRCSMAIRSAPQRSVAQRSA